MARNKRSMHDAVRAGAGAGAAWCCSRGIPLLALLVTLGSIPAEAATQQYLDSRSLDLWKNQDACISASIKQFPDHDLASLQQRDRSVDACLAAADLPPRAHLVPDP